MKKSLFYYEIPSEYRSYFEDLSRMIILQITANFLFSISNPEKYSILSYEFIKTLIYIIIGISMYWLVFRKLIIFNNPLSKDKDDKFYTGGL